MQSFIRWERGAVIWNMNISTYRDIENMIDIDVIIYKMGAWRSLDPYLPL